MGPIAVDYIPTSVICLEISWGFHFAWVFRSLFYLSMHCPIRSSRDRLTEEPGLFRIDCLSGDPLLGCCEALKRMAGAFFAAGGDRPRFCYLYWWRSSSHCRRIASRLLRRRFQEQVDRLQHLSSELQREALRGEPGPMLRFCRTAYSTGIWIGRSANSVDESRSTSDEGPSEEREADREIASSMGRAARAIGAGKRGGGDRRDGSGADRLGDFR